MRKLHPLRERQGASLDWLPPYVRWSYRLSDCGREPGEAEIAAHRGLLMRDALRPANFAVFLSYVEPGASFRKQEDDAAAGLDELLWLAASGRAAGDELAAMLRLLGPFTDANGRCGRALRMWRLARGSDEERALLRVPSPRSERLAS